MGEFPEKDIRSLIKWLVDHPTDTSTTVWAVLEANVDATWAVVLAWNAGYERIDSSDNPYINGEYRICGKIAFNNSYMKEYDMDWLMPFNKDGDVYDTETSIEDDAEIQRAINWWSSEWETMKELLDNGELFTERGK